MQFESTPEWKAAVTKFQEELADQEENEECHKEVHCSVANWIDGCDVRGFKMTARVFEIDGSRHVDIKHEFHSRARGNSFEHFAVVSIDVNGAGFKKVWRVGLQDDADTEEFVCTWLLAAVGHDAAGSGFPAKIRHTCDKWDGVTLRRVCRSVKSVKDSDWHPRDFFADVAEQQRAEAERNADEDDDGADYHDGESDWEA
ncbi:hypothetical protein FOA52_013811 [Chlamydomonas sp. UWO 241]|nr:hypothetical protein FOA52_013811 [Chlamydomonas sp. UWO 241]